MTDITASKPGSSLTKSFKKYAGWLGLLALPLAAAAYWGWRPSAAPLAPVSKVVLPSQPRSIARR